MTREQEAARWRVFAGQQSALGADYNLVRAAFLLAHALTLPPTKFKEVRRG